MGGYLKTTEDSKLGTKFRPKGRWHRCAWSNDVVARRAAAKTSRDLEILLEDYPDEPIQVLTLTLPGAWHWVRSASLYAQWDYIRERVTVKGLPGWHSMRGINTRLREAGARGGWHFFECKYNKKTEHWHLHCHSLFVGDVTSWLPASEKEVREDFSTDLKSSTSGKLRELGFGERYTLDVPEDEGQVLSYCTKLAYCTKQQFEGPEKHLKAFLRYKKPRLVEPFGDARMSKARRIEYYMDRDMHDMVDILSRQG